ncbi:MAG: hypothetical protein ACRCYU_06860 [Nocardioides sp.]
MLVVLDGVFFGVFGEHAGVVDLVNEQPFVRRGAEASFVAVISSGRSVGNTALRSGPMSPMNKSTVPIRARVPRCPRQVIANMIRLAAQSRKVAIITQPASPQSGALQTW